MRTALQGTQGDVRLSSLHSRLAAAADRLNLPRSAHEDIPTSQVRPQQGSGMLVYLTQQSQGFCLWSVWPIGICLICLRSSALFTKPDV